MIAVGADTHKESLAVCAVDELGRKLGELSVANCRQGFRAVERYLASLPEGRRVGIEGSGGFGAPLACVLRAAGEDVVEVPAHLTARQRKRLPHRGKSDPGDAFAIARVVASEPDLPQASREGLASDLKSLCSYRAQLLSERTRQANRLHADLAVLSAGYASRLPAFDSAARQHKVSVLLATLGGVRARLAERRLARIVTLGAEIGALEEQIGALIRASGSRLTEIRGVGALSAARLLGEAGDVRRFRSAAALAMAAGVAPISASSGKVQRHRLNRGGNRQLNFALFTAALVQSRCDPRGRSYLEPQARRGQELEGGHALPQAPTGQRRLPADDRRPKRGTLGDLGGRYGRGSGFAAMASQLPTKCRPDAMPRFSTIGHESAPRHPEILDSAAQSGTVAHPLTI